MPKGGARPGAGRKPGGANRKTREIADAAAEAGVTPLEVMLENMRRWYGEEKFELAQAAAKDAAPFIHPRLATTTWQGGSDSPLIIQVVTGISIPVQRQD